jgi:hypothetical protein
MREPLRFGNGYSFFNSNYFAVNDVKIPLTRRQPAWVKSLSETKRSTFSNGHSFFDKPDFCNWFVGFTDGNGSFTFSKTLTGK